MSSRVEAFEILVYIYPEKYKFEQQISRGPSGSTTHPAAGEVKFDAGKALK